MENQELFNKILLTFDNNDSDGIIELVTDDFEWQMLGDQTVYGKEELKKMFAEIDGTEMFSCTKELKLLDGDKAACNGIVKMKNPKGELFEMYYCDMYEFESGKLKKMVTYNIMKK